MTNTNCLENVCCPKCGQKDRFFIRASITAEVTDDGADIASDDRGTIEWNDESGIQCPECGLDGQLKDFRKTANLPPDPEGKNDDRASWAGSALATFIQITGTDLEDAMADLLADLMHWSDRNNYDFSLALHRALYHYEAETAGEPPF